MPADVLESRMWSERDGEDPNWSSHVAAEPGWVLCGQARLIAEAVPGNVVKVMVALFVVLPNVAVTISEPWTVVLVVNRKDPLVEPAAILTAVGTCIPALVELTLTVVTVVTGLCRRTVQFPDAPVWMERGVHVNEDRTGVAGGSTKEMLV